MAWNPWVIEEREFTQVATDVGSANSHSRSSDKSFASPRLGRLGGIDSLEDFGFGHLKGFHGWGKDYSLWLGNSYGIEKEMSH